MSSFSANEAGTRFQCALNGGTWRACTSGAGFPFTTQGLRMFAVRAIDAVGNIDSTPARRRFTLDTVAPSVSYTYKDLDARESTTEWTFSSNEAGATFECSVDGGTYVACPSPHTTVLGPGPRTFHVRAVDPAGNVGTSKGLEWTVAPLPTPQPSGPPAVTLGAPSKSLKAARSKGLSIPVTTNGPWSVTATLTVSAATAKKLKLGKRKTRIGKGTAQVNGQGKVVIKLTAKAKSKLRKARRFSATVSISATNAAGTTTRTRSVSLR